MTPLFVVVLFLAVVLHTASAHFKLLVYETNTNHLRTSTAGTSSSADIMAENAYRAGLDTMIFGGGSEFRGFGSKYAAATPLLKAMAPTDLVVIADSRDILINHAGNKLEDLEHSLTKDFESLVQDAPNAVVISAEAQCCVGALTFIKPGDLFDSAGKRTARACHSGKPGCLWNGDEKRFPWEGFMGALAELRFGSEVEDAYLNAGLMAGRAGDLLKLFLLMDIQDEEDDQAVLTDLLHHAPHLIRLDYEQVLFGNNRHERGMKDGCMFELDLVGQTRKLKHKEHGTTPMFVHSPGKFWDCHDHLADSLEQVKSQHARRSLSDDNYGKNNAASSSHQLSTVLLVLAVTLQFFVSSL